VRARLLPPARERATPQRLAAWLDDVAGELAAELSRDRDLKEPAAFRRAEKARLLHRFTTAFHLDAEAELATSADVLVANCLTSSEAAAGLRALDGRRDHVKLNWLRTHERVYPERDATWGLVGFESSLPAATGKGSLTYERA